MDNLTLSQVIQNNVRLKNLEESGGSEAWEDITSLFTVTSGQNSYLLSNNNVFELVGNIPLRITIELTMLNPQGEASRRGTIPLYFTITGTDTSSVYLLTNTIYSQSDDLFTGRLTIDNYEIHYIYGVSIPEETERPKILKVERLMGV